MIWRGTSRSSVRALGASLLVASAALCPSVARAEVRHDGDWDDDTEVTLNLDRVTRAEAVKRLASAAGWSVVFEAPPGELIDVHVKEQSAEKVLDILLSNGNYVAQRDDTLISIKRADADAMAAPKVAAPIAPAIPAVPAAPLPPPPPLPPLPPLAPRGPDEADDPSERGSDRVITGGSLRIEAGEVVHDVAVMGGNVEVFGKATGDVAAMGGSVRIHKGAHVYGDAMAVGGALSVEDGARVDGDVGVFGGVLRRGKDADIRGDVKADHGRRGRRDGRGHVESEANNTPPPTSLARRVAREVGGALTRMALLFAFGAVMSSLAASRMESLKVQLASRPMRTFATGIVASIVGVVLFIALCVTVIGIPFAIVGVLVAFFAACAGLCAALETIGGGLLAHRTRNPYVHLACGCALFMVASAIPFIGPLVTAALIFAGIGSVAATRAAGFIPNKNRSGGTPYRDAPVTV